MVIKRKTPGITEVCNDASDTGGKKDIAMDDWGKESKKNQRSPLGISKAC